MCSTPPPAQEARSAGFPPLWSLSFSGPRSSGFDGTDCTFSEELVIPLVLEAVLWSPGKEKTLHSPYFFCAKPLPVWDERRGIWSIWIQFLLEYTASDAGQRQAALARPKICGLLLLRCLTTPRLSRMAGSAARATEQPNATAPPVNVPGTHG